MCSRNPTWISPIARSETPSAVKHRERQGYEVKTKTGERDGREGKGENGLVKRNRRIRVPNHGRTSGTEGNCPGER